MLSRRLIQRSCTWDLRSVTRQQLSTRALKPMGCLPPTVRVTERPGRVRWPLLSHAAKLVKQLVACFAMMWPVSNSSSRSTPDNAECPGVVNVSLRWVGWTNLVVLRLRVLSVCLTKECVFPWIFLQDVKSALGCASSHREVCMCVSSEI